MLSLCSCTCKYFTHTHTLSRVCTRCSTVIVHCHCIVDLSLCISLSLLCCRSHIHTLYYIIGSLFSSFYPIYEQHFYMKILNVWNLAPWDISTFTLHAYRNQLATVEEDDAIWMANAQKLLDLTGSVPLGLYECPGSDTFLSLCNHDWGYTQTES